MLGVTTRTIREWTYNGKIDFERTAGGHRRIPLDEIERLQGIKKETIEGLSLAYCRCSTQKQEENLERQIGRVLEYCTKQGWKTELYKDIGSGLNDKRRQFNKLLKRIEDEEVCRVVIEYKDRITRHGFSTFEAYCKSHGVEVVIIKSKPDKNFEQEMADDILSLIASYSAKYYGRRGGRKKKENKDE